MKRMILYSKRNLIFHFDVVAVTARGTGKDIKFLVLIFNFNECKQKYINRHKPSLFLPTIILRLKPPNFHFSFI